MPLEPSVEEVTQLVADWRETHPESGPELLTLIYNDLRRLAASYMRRERPEHTLQATALLHEAYLRLFREEAFHWENREHLFRSMAQVMRRILVDHARTGQAGKRGGKQCKIELDEVLILSEHDPVELLALDEAMERLAKRNSRQSMVVERRFLAGLTVEEMAAMLGVSAETVKPDWRFAKVWLQREKRRSCVRRNDDGEHTPSAD